MNREGAETFLRLLAEAALQHELTPDLSRWGDGPGAGRTRVSVVGQALAAVGALDQETAADVLADFDLAVSVRRQPAASPGRIRFRTAPAIAARRGPPMLRPPATAAGQPPDDDPGQGAADRFAPIGLTVPFHDNGPSGELYLLAFAQTGSRARLIVMWGQPALSPEHGLGLEQPALFPVELFTVTDDRGAAYGLTITDAAGADWVGQLTLSPAPPGDVRWLEIAASSGAPVRVDLNPAAAAGAEPEFRAASHSAGEQLLILLATELLFTAAQFPLATRPERRGFSPRGVQALGTGLGDVIAALGAADLLPPLSPIPARLAALCAGLGLSGGAIAAAPADDLPEPWLSLLTYYQRRKQDPAPAHDGFAAMAAALPELDGIELAVIGLYNTQGSTALQLLARGVQWQGRRGPHGLNLDFPLSFWLRDSGGRWHVTRLAGWDSADREQAIKLALMPPLPRSATWVELLVGGRSGEVRARFPLRWGTPP